MKADFSADSDIRSSLAHILWIGGPSDAGKSTVTFLLMQRRRWQWYPCDLHEHNHLIARADPDLTPVNYAALDRSLDDTWVNTTSQALFDQTLASNVERFPMICDDLRKMPTRPPVLVEGPRLFPKLLLPTLSEPHQAIWLLPTTDFARQSQEKRDKPSRRFQSSDPERFRENFLGRDALLAEYIEREVNRHSLPFIRVDGTRSAEEIADQVEEHFDLYLNG